MPCIDRYNEESGRPDTRVRSDTSLRHRQHRNTSILLNLVGASQIDAAAECRGCRCARSRSARNAYRTAGRCGSGAAAAGGAGTPPTAAMARYAAAVGRVQAAPSRHHSSRASAAASGGRSGSGSVSPCATGCNTDTGTMACGTRQAAAGRGSGRPAAGGGEGTGGSAWSAGAPAVPRPPTGAPDASATGRVLRSRRPFVAAGQRGSPTRAGGAGAVLSGVLHPETAAARRRPHAGDQLPVSAEAAAAPVRLQRWRRQRDGAGFWPVESLRQFDELKQLGNRLLPN